MDVLVFIGISFVIALLLLYFVILRYIKRKIFIDPFNFFLLNSVAYFVIQVPFVFFPGNLYMVGKKYSELWPYIITCFGIEVLFLSTTVFVFLFFNSSFVSAKILTIPKLIEKISKQLYSGHKLYLFFLIPISIILILFIIKFGAALFLINTEGTARARTIILRDAAAFRFLFNFASTALAFILFYLIIQINEKLRTRQFARMCLFMFLFIVGFLAGFIVTGTRSFVLNPLIAGLVPIIMFTPKHNKMTKVVVLGFGLILMASILDIIRSGSIEFFIFKIFFEGNTFADFRDFVWSFSSFKIKDMEYWMGRPMLASWLSFIPASIFPFRDEWALGRAILKVVGWSNSDHFGIRPGIAGAYFYNGGFLFVLLAGLIRGLYLIWYQKVFDSLMLLNATVFQKVLTLFIADQVLGILFFLLNTGSLWTVYVYMIIIVLSAICVSCFKYLRIFRIKVNLK